VYSTVLRVRSDLSGLSSWLDTSVQALVYQSQVIFSVNFWVILVKHGHAIAVLISFLRSPLVRSLKVDVRLLVRVT
jgi:hypothetical protein